MKLSPNTRYAVRLLFELDAMRIPISIASLSERTGITLRTVENVHAVLKQHGVTDATVGPKGGITLQRPLSDISLGQLIEWFDEGVEFAVCCGEKANECPQQNSCETRAVWRGISAEVQVALNAFSLAEILRRYPKADFL